MKSILIKDTTREERQQIVHQALWGACGIDCEFCSGCDNRGGGRIESIYQPYIDGIKEIREINAEYNAPFVRWQSKCSRNAPVFKDPREFLKAGALFVFGHRLWDCWPDAMIIIKGFRDYYRECCDILLLRV